MSRHRVDGYRAFFRAYPEPGALCAIVRGADGSVVDLEVLDVTAAAVRFMAPFVPPDLGPLASRRLSELAASAEVAGLCAAVGRATDGGETAVELRAPDGRRYVVTVAPVTNDTVALLARDVSDLERSAEALREATERNRAAMLATKDGVVIQDLEGRITSASPAAARMLGLGFDELTGLTSMDPRWQALDAAGAPLSGDRHPAMRTLRTGTPERDVLMNLALPDGRRVLISVSTEPLRDASGGIVGVVSTFSDITDLAMANRQVEVSAELVRETLAGIAARDAQLRNALAELQEARRIAHLGVWRRDERTGEAEWSPEMREMAGLGPDDPLPGVEAVDAAVERQQQARMAALTRSAATGEPWEVEYPWHRPDGGVRWVLSRGMAEVDDDGAVIASHGTVIDITERKEAELALRASEEALRQRTAELEEARRIAGLGVWRADADRAQLHWDAAMHRLTGIVPGDGPLSSEALDRHVEPASIEERVRLIERSIATGEPWQQEYVFHRDDGTDVWLLAHGMAERDAEGRVIGFRGTAQDVTQRKRAELELQATQQQFRRMLDELVEGAVLLDHAWRLRYVNPALTTLPPGAPNPALGMSLFELVPGIGETELFARLARCVAEGVADRFEAQVELPSRPPRWY
ncbi:MAG: PAS domain-containing protein, partial [Chloroflexota bacterium]